MAETTEHLKEEIRRLRDVIFALSTTVLRVGATHTVTDHDASTDDAKTLLVLAEECFHCAQLPDLKAQIAEGLQAAGYELMAKAVEVEAAIQRRNRRKA